MAQSVYGGVVSGPGGLQIVIEPPIQFIERQSAELALALADLMPLWERLIPIMGDIEREVFSTRGHGSWPPLAESTIAQKSKHGYPLDPLVRTGALKNELTSGSAHHITPDSMVYGTDLDYAHWHQDGGTKSGRPPKRTLIDVDNVDARRKLEAGVVGWINLVVRGIWKT